MCGIAGLLATRTVADLPRKLAQLSTTLAHRGPDDLGFLTWDEGRDALLGRSPDGWIRDVSPSSTGDSRSST